MSTILLTQEPWYQQCRLEMMRYLNETYGRDYRFNDCYSIRGASFEEWLVFRDKEKISVLFKVVEASPNRKAVVTIYSRVDSLDYFIKQK